MRWLSALSILPLLVACNDKPEDKIGYFCAKTIEETVKYSTALVYGIESSVPRVEKAFPITIADLNMLESEKSIKLKLIAMNANGNVFSQGCDKLCGASDGMALIRKCRNTPGCKILGGIKNNVFYPFYTSDRDDGHICRDIQ